jgi:hypothetical protein
MMSGSEKDNDAFSIHWTAQKHLRRLAAPR